MTPAIVSIVEGQAEEEAVPVLIRRLLSEAGLKERCLVTRPVRSPRGSLIKPGGLERAMDLAVAKAGRESRILVLLDSDDDCPQRLGPALASRAKSQRPDILSAVVLAEREYEAWFLAAAASLAGRRGLRNDLAPPSNPHTIRDAKGWLSDRTIQANRKYSPIADQAAFTSVMSLEQARICSSFLRLEQKIRVLAGMQN